MPFDGPGDEFVDVVWAEGEFLALVREGPHQVEGRAKRKWHLYRSPDGLEWSRQRIGKTGNGHLVHAISAGPDGLVAVGCELAPGSGISKQGDFRFVSGRLNSCRQGVVWSSPDGRSWSREKPRAARRLDLTGVAVSGEHIVAVGIDDATLGKKDPRSAIVARRPNGGWVRVKAGLAGGSGLGALSPSRDGGFLLYGDCCSFGGPMQSGEDAFVLASPDGLTWERQADGLSLSPAPAWAPIMASGPTLDAIRATLDAPGVFTVYWSAADVWHPSGIWMEDFTSLPTELAIGPGGRLVAAGDSSIRWVGEVLPVGSVPAVDPKLRVGPVPWLTSLPAVPQTGDGQRAYLFGHAIDPTRCKPLGRKVLAGDVSEALAGIECGVVRRSVGSVRHYLFPDAAALGDWWSSTLDEAGRRGLQPGSGSTGTCAEGTPGEAAWPSDDSTLSGRVTCFRDGGVAQLRWTTDGTLIGSSATANDDDIGSLTRWFVRGREELLGADDTATGNEPGPDGSAATRRNLEGDLLGRVAPVRCQRWREDDDPFEFGADAAIQCSEPAPGITQLALFSFPDADSLGTFWSWRLDQLDQRPPETDTACGDGSQGITSWEHGEVACYTQRRVAKIRWIDERTQTYGILDATNRDLAVLYGWWEANQPSAPAPEAPDEAVEFDPSIPMTQEDQVAYLSARALDRERCVPMMPRGAASIALGAVAGIACVPTRDEDEEGGLRVLEYFLFPNADALQSWWVRTLEAVPRLNRRGEQRPGGGIEPDGGSLQTCGMLGYAAGNTNAGETGWARGDGTSGGRFACWRAPSPDGGDRIAWTVTNQLVGASAQAWPEWFRRAHPRRRQAYPSLSSGDAARPPFVDPAAMKKLPRGVGKEPPRGRESQRYRPGSEPGLPVGVVFPRVQGHCDEVGSVIDIDGAFWDAVAGVDPSGEAIRDVSLYDEENDRRTPIAQDFWEGTRVEFLKISDDQAQLRTPGGWVIAYERHDGPRRLAGCA